MNNIVLLKQRWLGDDEEPKEFAEMKEIIMKWREPLTSLRKSLVSWVQGSKIMASSSQTMNTILMQGNTHEEDLILFSSKVTKSFFNNDVSNRAIENIGKKIECIDQFKLLCEDLHTKHLIRSRYLRKYNNANERLNILKSKGTDTLSAYEDVENRKKIFEEAQTIYDNRYAEMFAFATFLIEEAGGVTNPIGLAQIEIDAYKNTQRAMFEDIHDICSNFTVSSSKEIDKKEFLKANSKSSSNRTHQQSIPIDLSVEWTSFCKRRDAALADASKYLNRNTNQTSNPIQLHQQLSKKQTNSDVNAASPLVSTSSSKRDIGDVRLGSNVLAAATASAMKKASSRRIARVSEDESNGLTKKSMQRNTSNMKDQPKVLKARVLYDFEPRNDNELHIKQGEVVIINEKVDDGWWKGTIGVSTGWFPSNYVEIMGDNKINNNIMKSKSIQHSGDEYEL